MNMKQMPYRVPDGFMELSKMRNKAAVRRADAARKEKRESAAVRWGVSAAAAVCCLVVGIVGYQRFENQNDGMAQLVAQMKSAPDEVMEEMAADAIEYAEDVNYL